MPDALGQRRLVGGIAADRQRLAKDRRVEMPAAFAPGRSTRGQGLRRASAFRRTASIVSAFRRTGQLHRIARGQRRERRARFRRRGDRPGDQVARSRTAARRRGPRPRRSARRRAEMRWRPNPAAGRRRRRPASGFAGPTQVVGRCGGDVGRHRDDDLIHVRMREERRDASLENRSPADRQQLLGARAHRAADRVHRPQ